MTNINTFQGQVGIGTNDPDYKLDVQDTSQAADYILARLITSAANSGTSSTGLRIEKAAGYGGIVKGFLSQGVGSGLSFHTLSGNTDLQVMNINNSGNVGIGTNLPKDDLHIFEASTGQTTGLFIEKQNGGSGTAQITFGVAASTEGGKGKAKAGIFFERMASNGRGDLHFCVDNSTDNNGVGIADKQMTITADGKVGIGTDLPAVALQVGANNETAPQFLWIRGNRVNEAGDISGFHFYNSANSGDRGNSRIINSRGVNNYGSDLQFWTNPDANSPATQKMVIRSTGLVGIGSSAPTQALDVAGQIGCTGLVTTGVVLRASSNLGISAGTYAKVADYQGLPNNSNHLITVTWNQYNAPHQVLWFGGASWYSAAMGGPNQLYAPWNSAQAVGVTQVYHYRAIAGFTFNERGVSPSQGSYLAHGITMTNTQSTGTVIALRAKARHIGPWF